MTLANGIRELAALKFLDGVTAYVQDVSEPEKALRRVIRDTREFFHAAHGCVATHRRDRADVELLFALPKAAVWDAGMLAAFIRREHPPLPADMAVAALQRRGRAWGAIAVIRTGHPFDRHDRRLLTRIATALSGAIHRIDRDRMLEVRNRIDRKIMEQLDPKDLFYQILDGLRSLTQYDHSSALLIRDESGDALRLVAEQIAWTKARSDRIGLRLPIAGDAAAMLQSEQVYGFDRHGASWRQWQGDPAPALAMLLDYNRDNVAAVEERRQAVPADRDTQREASMLCAPLVTRDGVIGVLKIAARHPGTLSAYDAELVEHFRSQAAVAIQNLHRTESLRARVLTAERKHAMADLARSVSHDVNNALGSMLPLVQQMQDDIRRGSAEPTVLAGDLEQIQKSLQVCRRIFGGMLSFARGSARRHLSGHVRRAVDTASAILKYGMARQGIELSVDVADDLPAVACGQNDLEQVFLNLLTNARDATPHGGTIVVTASSNDGSGVHVRVADTGCGIAPPDLPRVMEPFFTTKPDGNGLGLSICRSILWEVNSTLVIHSDAASGTRVEFVIPVAALQLHV